MAGVLLPNRHPEIVEEHRRSFYANPNPVREREWDGTGIFEAMERREEAVVGVIQHLVEWVIQDVDPQGDYEYGRDYLIEQIKNWGGLQRQLVMEAIEELDRLYKP